jgi:hypothetical protein
MPTGSDEGFVKVATRRDDGTPTPFRRWLGTFDNLKSATTPLKVVRHGDTDLYLYKVLDNKGKPISTSEDRIYLVDKHITPARMFEEYTFYIGPKKDVVQIKFSSSTRNDRNLRPKRTSRNRKTRRRSTRRLYRR